MTPIPWGPVDTHAHAHRLWAGAVTAPAGGPRSLHSAGSAQAAAPAHVSPGAPSGVQGRLLPWEWHAHRRHAQPYQLLSCLPRQLKSSDPKSRRRSPRAPGALPGVGTGCSSGRDERGRGPSASLPTLLSLVCSSKPSSVAPTRRQEARAPVFSSGHLAEPSHLGLLPRILQNL